MESEYYTPGFYSLIREGAARSAEAMVPLTLQLVPAKSVVDVGCGDGTWLAAFRKFGVDDVFGVDGEYVRDAVLQIPEDRFCAMDLSKPFRLDRTFDVAMCLEVAEHLPVDSAVGFVESLTRLAPAILFSAAVPFQGGTHHINEQWPDRWAALFEKYDYVPVDFIRRRVWKDEQVDWWYAQNTLLFTKASLLESNATLKAEFERTNPDQLCLVHPRQYLHSGNAYREALERAKNPGLGEATRLFLASLKRSTLWRFGGRRKDEEP